MKFKTTKNLHKFIAILICIAFLLTSTSLTSYAVEEPQVQQQVVAVSRRSFSSFAYKHKIGFVATGLALLAAAVTWAFTNLSRTDSVKSTGLKSIKETNDLFEKVSDGNFDTKIYGQEQAIENCLSAVKLDIMEIENMKKASYDERSHEGGHVIYMIGESGTGKFTTAKSIAETIHSNSKAILVIDTSSINNGESLADQLYSKIASHISKNEESVIVFKDYDQMKILSNPRNRIENRFQICHETDCKDFEGKAEDKTFDEILAGISELGKIEKYNEETGNYDVVDFSKTIIFVTSSESRAEFETNFGIDGLKGGRPQRIHNVVEFKPLNFQSYRKIVIDILNEVRAKLTDLSGDFKLGYFQVSNDTINALASLIESNKKNLERLEKNLKIRILTPYLMNIGDEIGKSFELVYEQVNSDLLHPSNFVRREINRPCLDMQRIELPKDQISSISNDCACSTCKTFFIPIDNLRGRLDEFKSQLPFELREQAFKEILYLVKREIKDNRHLNNNCLLITVNLEGSCQDYITVKFLQKEAFGPLEKRNLLEF